jgi:hypothetical protein
MEQPVEPTTFKQAQDISNRIELETKHDYSAAFDDSVETMRVAEFLTDTESEGLTALFARQSGLVARMAEETEDVDTLTADEVEPALEHVRASITGALKFDEAAKEILVEAEELSERKLRLEESALIRRLHERNLSAFESMARWSLMSRAVLRHAGIVLNLVGISMAKLIPKDQSGATLQSRLGTDDLRGLDRKAAEANVLPEDPQDEKTGNDMPQLQLPEVLVPLLRDKNINIGDVLPRFAVSFIRTYKTWQKAELSLPEMPETFGGVASETTQEPTELEPESKPAPQELKGLLNEELQALVAAHAEQVSEFRPTRAQMQRHGLRPFSNMLRQMSRAGELTGVTEELPADTAKRLTGLLHVAEEFGQNPAALRERLITLVHNEYVSQVNIDRILTTLRSMGVRQGESDWLPVTRDFDLLHANRKALESKILELWSPAVSSRTREEAAAAIGTSLQAFRKAAFEVRHPERRLARLAKPLGAVALPPDAKPEQSHHTSSRQNQAVSDTLRAIAASEVTSENKRKRALVLLRFIDLAESQRKEGGEEGFGDLRYSDPIDSGKRYYSVKFRSPHDNSEWHVLESFEPETATYAIPNRLVEDYGTLKEFVSDFGKEDQRDFGSVQVIHVKDWTPESHIEYIFQKIKPENVVNEPPVPLDEIADEERNS